MEIREQLATLGISGEIYKQGKEMKICCPFHDDSNPSFSINLETGIWMCYSRCGGGDWMQFVERIRVDEQYAPLKATEYEKPKTPMLKSLVDRGFTRPMLDKWDIVWDEDVGAMRLPIYDRWGKIDGKIWRYPEGVQPKYRYERGFQRSETLYGLWKFGLDSSIGDLILVEGPLDCVWVHEAGLNVLAILGSSLSETQVLIVKDLHPKRILLCFDNDPAGQLATLKAASLLKASGCWVYRVKMPERWKDIQEVPLEKVVNVMKKMELSVNGKGMVHSKYRRWSGTKTGRISGIWRR